MTAAAIINRALAARIEALEDALSQIVEMAEQFDADPDFRSIEQLATLALDGSRYRGAEGDQ